MLVWRGWNWQAGCNEQDIFRKPASASRLMSSRSSNGEPRRRRLSMYFVLSMDGAFKLS